MRENKAKFTAKYTKSNNFVVGYFPNDINYPNESFIDTNDIGYIEITKSEWENRPDQAIVNGNTIEAYIKPDDELLQEAKDAKIAQLAINRENLAEKSTVAYNQKTYANSQNARIAILNFLQKLTDDITTAPYFTYPEKEIVNLNRLDFISLRNLIESNESSLRVNESGLIQDINNCTTVEEVNNINIDLN